MNVLIGLEMEGVSGIHDIRALFLWHEEYHAVGRRLITDDLNAVLRGLRQAGIGRIRAVDYHFGGGNLIEEEVEGEVEIQNGLQAFRGSLEEGGWDALAMVGMHAMGGVADGFLSHSFAPYLRVRVNGASVGEIGVLSALAAAYGVPTLLVAGDAATVRESRAILPNTVAVSVKQARDRATAEVLPPEEACRRLEEGAEMAGRSRIASLHPAASPVTVEMRFPGREAADLIAAGLPGANLTDLYTVTFESPDFVRAVSTLHLGVRLYEGDLIDPLFSRIGSSKSEQAHIAASWAAFEAEWLAEPQGVW